MTLKHKYPRLRIIGLPALLFLFVLFLGQASAATVTPREEGIKVASASSTKLLGAYQAPVHYCGAPGNNRVQTTIDLGCKGEGNPVADMIFGIIRFLSDGVGLVVVGSIIVAGIQFTTSGDEPQAKANAIGRIRSSILALVIYIFAYAMLNYVIPAGFFQ
jgi:hypothetical protein